ncbi:MAG: nickel-responsive transcriptional regulator NikR [Bacteroidales bacterium]
MSIKRFGVSLEEDVLKTLDNYVVENSFSNRSQALRFLIEKQSVKKKWKEDQLVAGVLVLVYDHHKRDITNQLVEVQHDYHHHIIAVQHVHLDHHNCLETIALKGRAIELTDLSNRIIGLKGIRNGKLVMSLVG